MSRKTPYYEVAVFVAEEGEARASDPERAPKSTWKAGLDRTIEANGNGVPT